jgi:hypothetical protein
MAGRRRGGGVVLVVFLLIGVLVAVGLYAGDAYLRGRAEKSAAVQLQNRLGTPDTPTIDIQGGPFLTQVAARHLRRVHVVADDLGTTGTGGQAGTVPVQHTDLVLSDVTTTDWFQTMTARRVEGTALLRYSDLGALSSVPISYAGDGRLRVQQTASLFGVQLKALVTGTPQLDVGAQTLTLADPQLSVDGVDLPGKASAPLLRAALKPIPVEGLPYGLQLSSVSAEDDALHAGLQGDGVTFTR